MDTLEDMTRKLYVTRAKRFLFRCLIILLSPVWIPVAAMFAIWCIVTEPIGLIVLGAIWESYWNYEREDNHQTS